MRCTALLGRIGLVVAGLLVGVLLLEGALQAAALVVRATGREMPAQWATGRFRVLCIGDSNTYGLWLDRSESYPSQLEALWNERVKTPKVEVLNFGIPGTNSSRVLRDFPRILDTFAPDVLVVMLGVNDYWTRPFQVEGTPEAARRSFFEKHSLVYKLYYLIARSFDARELDVQLDRPKFGQPREEMAADHKLYFGGEEFDVSFAAGEKGARGDSAALTRNLTAIIEQARAFGVPLYLMSYPGRWDLYPDANVVIRRVARATGTPLIDLTEVFRPLCPERPCPEYLFRDQHPNARGYAVVAERVLERLRADL